MCDLYQIFLYMLSTVVARFSPAKGAKFVIYSSLVNCSYESAVIIITFSFISCYLMQLY